MIKKGFKLFGTGLLMSAVLSMTAFAATAITSVNFTYTISGDSAISEGYNEPTISIVDNGMFDVSDFSCTGDTASATGKTPLTYTMTLSARRGYYFPAANSVNVSGSCITELTRKTTDSNDNAFFTIRFRAYPYIQLAAPEYVTTFDKIKGSKSNSEAEGREGTLNFNKNGAPKIEYVIGYVDQNGEYKTKSGTTTNSYISVANYNKQYKGSDSSKQSCYIRGIAIRAAGTLGSNTNVAPSPWVFIDGGLSKMDTEEYFYNYTVWDDLNQGTGTSTGSVSGPSGGSAAAPAANVNVFGWQGSGDNWYYYSNGTIVKGWLFDGSNWYYCDPSTGVMRSGWIQDSDGRWYYMNQNHDGTFGRMVTGWLNDRGVYYYLNPNAGGPMGSMVTGTVQIGGKNYNFASSGALIG